MAIISQKIVDLLNFRIQQEEQSSRIYKAMSVWLGLNGYTNSEKLWQKYSNEELTHANWAYQYLLDLDIKPITPSQEQPQNDFKGLPNIIALSIAHEIKITEQCKSLSKACLSEGDVMTFVIAQKYVAEQIEELGKIDLLVKQLETFGENKTDLRLLDNWIGDNLL